MRACTCPLTELVPHISDGEADQPSHVAVPEEKQRESASGTISEIPLKLPLPETQTCNLLIQDFVVFGVRELLQLQRILSDKSHRQMKIVIPQL